MPAADDTDAWGWRSGRTQPFFDESIASRVTLTCERQAVAIGARAVECWAVTFGVFVVATGMESDDHGAHIAAQRAAHQAASVWRSAIDPIYRAIGSAADGRPRGGRDD